MSMDLLLLSALCVVFAYLLISIGMMMLILEEHEDD